jgi:hypothetical protein
MLEPRATAPDWGHPGPGEGMVQLRGPAYRAGRRPRDLGLAWGRTVALALLVFWFIEGRDPNPSGPRRAHQQDARHA